MKLTVALSLITTTLAAGTTTTTSTVTSGSASTIYTFLSGNPPTASRSVAAATVTNAYGNASSGSSDSDIVVEFATVQAPTVTSTFYPCANPFPSRIPTLPYGDGILPLNNFSTENSLFEVGTTTEGASAQACCNACFFELANCIQAYWYSYEGCVVSLATNASLAGAATRQHVSMVCPAGIFNGLSYVHDTHPSLGSTGNIAGPCG